MSSAIATTYNLRPEQKLQDHTEYPRHEDQFPSARTHPSPERLPRSLESPQHVIREKEKASQRRQLVTIPTMLWADRDFGCAVICERQPDKSDGDIQEVVAQDYPQRQQDSPPRPMRLSRQLDNR